MLGGNVRPGSPEEAGISVMGMTPDMVRQHGMGMGPISGYGPGGVPGVAPAGGGVPGIMPAQGGVPGAVPGAAPDDAAMYTQRLVQALQDYRKPDRSQQQGRVQTVGGLDQGVDAAMLSKALMGI